MGLQPVDAGARTRAGRWIYSLLSECDGGSNTILASRLTSGAPEDNPVETRTDASL